jgi:O-antigen/teichoic acid export membrane protein
VSPAERFGHCVARDAVTLVISSYLGQIVVLILAFILRKELGPEGMGYVAIAQLSATYAPYVGLGAFQVAEREIAYENGRGDAEAAARMENDASVAALVLTALVVIAGVVFAAYQLSHDNALVALVSLVVAGTIASQQFAIRATIVLRTTFRFRELGWSVAATSVGMTALTLIGALFAGSAGALVGAIAGSFLQSVVLMRIARPTRLRAAQSPILARIYRFAPGFLMLGLGTVVLGTIDQLAVGSLLGSTALGVYSAAYLGNGFALRIPTMISAAIYPRMQQEFGRSSDPASVYRLAQRTAGVIAIVLPFVIAVFAFGVPLGIQFFLPEFRSAVPASRLLLVGILGLAVSMPAAQFLVTTNRQWTVVAVTTALVGAMTMAYLGLASVGHLTVTTAAMVDAAGYLAFAGLLQAVASLTAGRHVGRSLFLVMTQIVTGVAIIVAGMVADSLTRGNGGAYLVGAAAGLTISLFVSAAASGVVISVVSGAKDDISLLLQAVTRRITPRRGDRWRIG